MDKKINIEKDIITILNHIEGNISTLDQKSFLSKLSEIDKKEKYIKKCKLCIGTGHIVGKKGSCVRCKCGLGYHLQWNNIRRLGFHKCKVCNGYGVTTKKVLVSGYYARKVNCHTCNGSGIVDWVSGLIE